MSDQPTGVPVLHDGTRIGTATNVREDGAGNVTADLWVDPLCQATAGLWQQPRVPLTDEEIRQRCCRVPEGELRDAFAVDPVVHACLTHFTHGGCTYEEALERAVVALWKEKATLSHELDKAVYQAATAPDAVVEVKPADAPGVAQAAPGATISGSADLSHNLEG